MVVWFLQGLFFQFPVCLYIMGPNRISESKVMVVWLCPGIPCAILSVSIYHGPPLDIRVKSYGWLNLLHASLSNFKCLNLLQASIGMSSQMFMDVWIFLGILSSISSVWIHYGSQSDIRVKSYGWLNMPKASLFCFKFLDILRASIRIFSQNLWPFEFYRGFLVEFWAFQYIIGLNQISKSNVMSVWIARGFLVEFSVSIYYGPQLDIWVKCYVHLSLSGLPCSI